MKRFKPLTGRGINAVPDPRFAEFVRQEIDDGWGETDSGAGGEQKVKTELYVDHSRTIITRNRSPDVPFEQSINPYKGCEHGCCYCFARPTHAYLDLSPGLDFESKIFCKPDAAELLTKELSHRNYVAAPIGLGANTDAYQPVERRLGITREIIKVLKNYQHPFAIITKSSLVERDIDLLAPMAKQGLVKIIISVTTLQNQLSRRLEPRAAAPARRLETIRNLHEAGIPTGVLFAPVIPALNDSEIETVLQKAAEVGAESAGYVMLRLPHELKDMFADWLAEYYPLRAAHVMNIIRAMRSGKMNSTVFGERMRGTGEFASLISQRFKLAAKNAGLNQKSINFNLSAFRVPEKSGDQMTLL